MARISSTTLFKFTTSFEYLINTLEEGAYCNNTLEKFTWANSGYLVPMACFCDIPLSLIKEHLGWYGRYGIGITKRHARMQGARPVWYVTKEQKFLSSLVKRGDLHKEDLKHLIPYMKQYRGKQAYQGGEAKTKRFYDEREWRYVPPGAMAELFISKEAMAKTPDKPVQKHQRMKIHLEAIEYIIIAKPEKLDQLLKELRRISHKFSFSYDTLVSKVITAQQIERDF